jgi:hypothetical protein
MAGARPVRQDRGDRAFHADPKRRTATLSLRRGWVVALVFVPVYLIAAYIFGDSGVLNSQVIVGRIVVALELLVFVTALVGWWGDRYEITISTALLVVGTFQAFFAKDIGSSSEVHTLRGLLALAVFAPVWSTFVRTRAEVRTVGAA